MQAPIVTIAESANSKVQEFCEFNRSVLAFIVRDSAWMTQRSNRLARRLIRILFEMFAHGQVRERDRWEVNKVIRPSSSPHLPDEVVMKDCRRMTAADKVFQNAHDR